MHMYNFKIYPLDKNAGQTLLVHSKLSRPTSFEPTEVHYI